MRGESVQMQRGFQKSVEPATLIPSAAQKLYLREKNIIMATEVSLAAKALNAGKAAGCDEIWPELLEPWTGKDFWMTRVFQVAWRSERTMKGWQTGWTFPYTKTRMAWIQFYWGISLLNVSESVCQVPWKKLPRDNWGCQCGFRSGRCTIDQIFSNKLSKNLVSLQEMATDLLSKPKVRITRSIEKGFKEITKACHWRLPAADCHIIVFLLRRLYICVSRFSHCCSPWLCDPNANKGMYCHHAPS